jgi:hypothetical protein
MTTHVNKVNFTANVTKVYFTTGKLSDDPSQFLRGMHGPEQDILILLDVESSQMLFFKC